MAFRLTGGKNHVNLLSMAKKSKQEYEIYLVVVDNKIVDYSFDEVEAKQLMKFHVKNCRGDINIVHAVVKGDQRLCLSKS